MAATSLEVQLPSSKHFLAGGPAAKSGLIEVGDVGGGGGGERERKIRGAEMKSTCRSCMLSMGLL
eukprot:679043-Hanusia_phi.AAC.1